MISRQAFYEGRDQGVGFRWTVKNIAKGYDVTGTVQNLPDGRVELHVTGDSDEVEDFLTAIAESGLKSHIRKILVLPDPKPQPAKGFEILS